MSQLDPRVEVVRKEYGLNKDDFWELPQGRDVWLVKHAALEVVAAKAGISFDMPEILEAKSGEGVAAICVRGFYGERSIWSIGEASPKNCKNAYPWAIAEKRAIDRVILKLIGLHGLVYSEEESDDFRPSRQDEPAKPTRHALKKDIGDITKPDRWDEFERELLECTTIPQLNKFKLAWSAVAEAQGWQDGELGWRTAAREEINKRQQVILNGLPDDDTFPGDRPSNGNRYIDNFIP